MKDFLATEGIEVEQIGREKIIQALFSDIMLNSINQVKELVVKHQSEDLLVLKPLLMHLFDDVIKPLHD